MSISRSKWPMLQTMASFGITSMCSPRMMSRLPVAVTKMLPRGGGLFHRRDFVAFHRGLQGVDRVDLGDDHAGAQRLHRMGTALADVAVAGHDHDLAGHHDVGGPLDAVGQRFAAAVEVVELALGDRVVDVDGRHLQLARWRASGTGDARRWWSLPTGRGCRRAARETSGGPWRSGRRRRRGSCSAAGRRGRTASARCTSRTPRRSRPSRRRPARRSWRWPPRRGPASRRCCNCSR